VARRRSRQIPAATEWQHGEHDQERHEPARPRGDPIPPPDDNAGTAHAHATAAIPTRSRPAPPVAGFNASLPTPDPPAPRTGHSTNTDPPTRPARTTTRLAHATGAGPPNSSSTPARRPRTRTTRDAPLRLGDPAGPPTAAAAAHLPTRLLPHPETRDLSNGSPNNFAPPDELQPRHPASSYDAVVELERCAGNNPACS